MAVYCGIDWAEGHHDIALVDDDGKLIAKRRINESVDGVAELTGMLAADSGQITWVTVPWRWYDRSRWRAKARARPSPCHFRSCGMLA